MKESCCELLAGSLLEHFMIWVKDLIFSSGYWCLSNFHCRKITIQESARGEVRTCAGEAFHTWTHTPTEVCSHGLVLLLRWLTWFHTCNADTFCNSLRRAECSSSLPLSWNYSLPNVDYTRRPKWVFITYSDDHLWPELYVFSGTDCTFVSWSWHQTRLASQTNNLRDTEGGKDRKLSYSAVCFSL